MIVKVFLWQKSTEEWFPLSMVRTQKQHASWMGLLVWEPCQLKFRASCFPGGSCKWWKVQSDTHGALTFSIGSKTGENTRRYSATYNNVWVNCAQSRNMEAWKWVSSTKFQLESDRKSSTFTLISCAQWQPCPATARDQSSFDWRMIENIKGNGWQLVE